jgi:uncharacterized membrane protein
VLAEIVAQSRGTSLVPPVEAVVGPICHHDPARTLPGLPVCARCTGVWLGGAVAPLLLMVPARPVPMRRAAIALLGGAALALAAALAELFGGIATGNALRVGLGLPLGAVLPGFLALGAAALFRAEVAKPGPAGRTGPAPPA